MAPCHSLDLTPHLSHMIVRFLLVPTWRMDVFDRTFFLDDRSTGVVTYFWAGGGQHSEQIGNQQ
jgi:hypothetical protein